MTDFRAHFCFSCVYRSNVMMFIACVCFMFAAHEKKHLGLLFASTASLSCSSDRLSWWKLTHFYVISGLYDVHRLKITQYSASIIALPTEFSGNFNKISTNYFDENNNSRNGSLCHTSGYEARVRPRLDANILQLREIEGERDKNEKFH